MGRPSGFVRQIGMHLRVVRSGHTFTCRFCGQDNKGKDLELLFCYKKPKGPLPPKNPSTANADKERFVDPFSLPVDDPKN
jgi:hypothetical protein